MANHESFTTQDIDRMKNDAIRRARQMQSRATITGNTGNTSEQKNRSTEPIKPSAQTSTNNSRAFSKLPFLSGFNDAIANLGLSSEQLIIFAIILMLCENRDNRMLIMALLYIAL